MTIKVRLSGEPDEIAQLVEHLRDQFQVAGADRAYPNRGSFGARVYLELRDADPHQPTQPVTEQTAQRVRSERVRPDRKGLEP
ncbi:hypothetical protein JOF29_005709 [Kribbella aluminosa]|uniref:Uncharacterized protein n=1 Tax=Kribbella aluminosa TaxID=416017 RepID=A0ABS4USJ3_9ACTN|nr:hypothetical protein [Kribbella aluminosa]MBP2354599.1 hypothetical protein [Kribbella aluminosa]